MNVVINSEPKDMGSEELAWCLGAGADYKLHTIIPFVARMHGIDMEHWLRASADRIRTLTAEVERLRHELTMCAIRYERCQDGTTIDIVAAAYDMRCIARAALNGGSHE